MDPYLTAADARTLAASLMALPGFARLLSLDDSTLGGVLVAATVDVDTAMRYQGRRWDISSAQTLEFPRIAYGGLAQRQEFIPLPPDQRFLFAPNTIIWDWDDATQTAVVPQNVKLATLYQAAWLMQPQYAARLEAIRSGLAAEGIGTGSETLAKLADLPATGLGQRASQIMQNYRLRTGQML